MWPTKCYNTFRLVKVNKNVYTFQSKFELLSYLPLNLGVRNYDNAWFDWILWFKLNHTASTYESYVSHILFSYRFNTLINYFITTLEICSLKINPFRNTLSYTIGYYGRQSFPQRIQQQLGEIKIILLFYLV